MTDWRISDHFPNEGQDSAKEAPLAAYGVTIKSTTRLRAYYTGDDELMTHAVNSASEWIASQEAQGSLAPTRVSSLNAGAEIMRFRSRLAELTSVQFGLPPEQAWGGEVRTTALQLQRALQSSAEYIFSQFPLDEAWKGDSVPKAIAWTSSCRFSQSSEQAPEENSLLKTEEHFNVGFHMYNRDGKWNISSYELEAVLGLWLWSLKRSELFGPTAVEHLTRSKMVVVETSKREEIEAALYLWVTQTRQVREYTAVNGASRRDNLSIPTSSLTQSSKQNSGAPPRADSANMDDFTILGIPTNGSTSLLQLMAQDIYTVFINRIVDIVGDLRGSGDPEDYLSMRDHSLSTAYRAAPLFELTNTHIDALANALISAGIATREEALMSIVPAFLHQLKLPLLDEDMVQNLLDWAKSLRRDLKFREGAALIAWVLSGCPVKFHKQVLRCLGDLYRRAALSKKRRDHEYGLSGMRDMEKRYSDLALGLEIQDILSCYAHLYDAFHRGKTPKAAFRDADARQHILYGPDCPKRSHEQEKEDFQLALTLSERIYFPNGDKWACHDFTALLQWALVRDFPELIEDLWASASSPRPLQSALDCKCELETIHSLLDWPGNDVNGNDTGVAPGDLTSVPLVCAIKASRPDVVCSILRRGVTLHQQDRLGITPLHRACQFSDMTTIQLLLDKGANFHEKDNEGRTALHFAAGANKEVVIQFLLEKGAGIHAKDDKGRTALHVAAEANCEVVIQFLLEKGTHIHEKDNEGRTALHSAAKTNSKVVIQSLLEKGADLHGKDDKRRTALHYAAANFRHEGVIQLMLEQGAHIHEKDNEGQTPLHVAADRDADRIAQYLLDMGADIDEKNNDGQTPLHVAASGWNPYKVVHVLLEMGADIHNKDSQGRTPLHLAAALRMPERTVLLLLQKGANIHDKDSRGQTPLHFAARNGCEEILQLLLEMIPEDEVVGSHWSSLWAVIPKDDEEMAQLLREWNIEKPLHVEEEEGESESEEGQEEQERGSKGEGEEEEGKDTMGR